MDNEIKNDNGVEREISTQRKGQQIMGVCLQPASHTSTVSKTGEFMKEMFILVEILPLWAPAFSSLLPLLSSIYLLYMSTSHCNVHLAVAGLRREGTEVETG